MPSTYTTRNRAELQAPGENNNSWGTLLNTNSLALFDQALDGMTSFALSGSKTLTTNNGASDEARCRYVNVTSGTGGTITVANVEKVYIVRNATSGTLTFTTGSGTTCTVATGQQAVVVSEGGNVCRSFPIGSILTTLSVTGNATLGDANTDTHTINGDATHFGSSGAEGIKLKASGSDHVFLAIYARSGDPSTRSGYLGYGASGITDMTLANSISNGDINLLTSGASGNVTVSPNNVTVGTFTPSGLVVNGTFSVSGVVTGTLNVTGDVGLASGEATADVAIGGASSTSARLFFAANSGATAYAIQTVTGSVSHDCDLHRFRNLATSSTFMTVGTSGVAITGALSAAGLLSTTAGQLNTGTIITRFENQEVNPPAGAAGRGLEIIGQHSNGFSYLQCYNRTTAASAPLIIDASVTYMKVGGVTIATASAAGLAADLLFSSAAGQLNTGSVSTRWENLETSVPAGAAGRGIEIIGNHTNGNSYILAYNRSTSAYVPLHIDASAVRFGQITTTASAANAFLDGANNNNLLRSTSARRYKTDITDVAPDDARAILEKLRPILYRSAALHDDPDKRYYGLIAEEVAEVCPELVHWVDGAPDGVMYDRLPVLLIAAMHARPA